MSVSDRVPPRSDAMPTTRGTNFYLATTVAELRRRVSAWPQPEDAERELDARPVADGPAAPASVFAARECGWLDAIVDWAPIPAEALAAVTAGQP